jgi:hypothetical protein
MDLTDFIIFEVDYEKRQSDFIYVDEPIMVQVFNHFQLYHHGKLYRFDSFILSFIAWLKIMERDYRRNLRGCDISDWYMEILATKDPKVRMWEPASLFGSDDEEESSPTGSDDDDSEESSSDRDDAPDADSASSAKKKKDPNIKRQPSDQDPSRERASACSDSDPFAIKSVM